MFDPKRSWSLCKWNIVTPCRQAAFESMAMQLGAVVSWVQEAKLYRNILSVKKVGEKKK